jgi:hypothetical protein
VPLYFKLPEDLPLYLKANDVKPKDTMTENISFIVDLCRDYGKKKRTWLKAMHFLVEIIALNQKKQIDNITQRDLNVIKYQFAINFMSKKPDEMASFVEQELSLMDNCKDFVNDHLLPLLH